MEAVMSNPHHLCFDCTCKGWLGPQECRSLQSPSCAHCKPCLATHLMQLRARLASIAARDAQALASLLAYAEVASAWQHRSRHGHSPSCKSCACRHWFEDQCPRQSLPSFYLLSLQAAFTVLEDALWAPMLPTLALLALPLMASIIACAVQRSLAVHASTLPHHLLGCPAGPDYRAVQRNLALELVRVTEAAALAGGKWFGKGDKNAADQVG